MEPECRDADIYNGLGPPPTKHIQALGHVPESLIGSKRDPLHLGVDVLNVNPQLTHSST